MAKRVRLLGVVLVIGLLALAGCTSQTSSGASSGASAKASSSGASSSSASSDVMVVGNEDTIEIALERGARTESDWKCAIEPEGIISQVYKETRSESSNESVAGDSVTDVFTFRAVAPGEATLSFMLVRENDGPAERQTYAFTVDSNLKMTLNPYKSNFENEPIWWGSNS